MCKRQTKYSSITCGKSVCVRFECSVAEITKIQLEKRVAIV